MHPNWARLGATLLALLILYPAFPSVWGLYGPDEPRYASIAREMARSGDWLTPVLDGKLWFEKPPLLYWLGACGYRLGLGPEAAPRVPIGLFSAGFLVWFGWYLRRWLTGRQAAMAAAVLATAAGWVAYSNVAVTDVPLAICFCVAMLLARSWIDDGRWRDAALAGLFFGLATLAKGLVPLALAAPLLWFARRRFKQWPLVGTATLLVAAPWYWTMWTRHRWAFFDEFILEHHFSRFASNALQHEQPFWFYIPVLLGLLVPWTPFVSLRDKYFVAWAGFGLVFFSAATNKLPGYLMPLLPAIAVLVALRIGEARWAPKLAAGMAILLAAAKLVGLPMLDGRLTARTLAATAPARDACANEVPRSLRYGLHYYMGRPVLDCWQAAGANPVPATKRKPGLRYRVRQNAGTLRGRLIVFTSPDGYLPSPKVRPETLWSASRDVVDWAGGEAVFVDAFFNAHPGPITFDPPGGEYYLTAVLDPEGDFGYAGFTHADWAGTAKIANLDTRGDTVYDVVLDGHPPVPVPLKPALAIRSELLSRFHREPVNVQVDVKPGTQSRYLVLHAHGESRSRSRLRETLRTGATLLFAECHHKFGHHAFADSDVNGPWARALVEEVLPRLPGSGPVHLIGEGLGGWGAVYLKQRYPDIFGDAYALRPDPLNFANFLGMDLTGGLQKLNSNVEFALALKETVLAASGGRWNSWESVFGPRTSEHVARQLFDRGDGSIDPAVREAWLRYNLAARPWPARTRVVTEAELAASLQLK